MSIFSKIILNTAIGAVLIIIWLQFVNINQILQTLSKVNPASLLPIFIFMFISPVIRALMLKIFLKDIQKIPLLDLISLNGAAMMLNFFIPIRAGEFAKGVYLNNRYNLPLAKSVVWIFLDRFVDLLVIILLAAIMVALLPTSLPSGFSKSAWLIFIIALSLSYISIFKSDFALKIVNFLNTLLIEKHIKIYFNRFSHFILDSLRILNRHPKDLFLLAVTTILAYGADAAIFYFTFLAVSKPQDFLIMYLAQLLSALTYIIPAAPGYVGSAEASGLLIFSGIFGIEANLASATIVLFHVLTVIFVLLFGITSIYFLKINVGDFAKKILKREK